MIKEEDVYRIGVITKTHGVSGELSMTFTDDVFDRVDAEYLVCKMDGILVPFFMEEYRFKNNTTILVKFEGIDTEEKARSMAGVEVFFPKELAAGSLEEGEYSWNYFVGFELIDIKSGVVGNIVAVNDATVNVLFEVECKNGEEILIPATDELVDDIDHDGRKIYMELPDGLLSLEEWEDNEDE